MDHGIVQTSQLKIKGRQALIAVTAKCHSDFGEQMFGTLEGTIEFQKCVLAQNQ